MQGIFGNLRTSSNYNDAEQKLTGGRNGYGAKLTNVFSQSFKVETYDAVTKQRYKQVWRNNMMDRSEPIISQMKVRAYVPVQTQNAQCVLLAHRCQSLACVSTRSQVIS